jgi:chemotaxis protein methyltransferase CheR
LITRRRVTTLSANREEFDLFKKYIEQHCSIALTDDKKYLLESRLTKLVVESGCDTFTGFYKKISQDHGSDLRDKIIDAMTTNETLWFRDGSPWTTFRDRVMPNLIHRVEKGQRKIRIWSAACSTGQEPYTIGMLVDDGVRKTTGQVTNANFEILATDISTSALFIAMAGRYDRISMNRGFTEDWATFKERYFDRAGSIRVIKQELKNMITFKKFNLQDSFALLGVFDVIFIRNVAIYFSEAFKIDLYKRLQRIMTNDAYLFLGSSESLLGYSSAFQAEQLGRATYYRNTNGR